MTLETWTIYVAAVLALMITPGPSQLLMLSNSAAHGFRRSLATAVGDLTANACQMLAAGLGLAAILAETENALLIVKWLGVYLIWLGVRMIYRARVSGQESSTGNARATLRSLWLQGFITSASNPKAVIFFAALFPQFIQPQSPFWPQFLTLSATYIIVDGLFLSGYGFGSSWIASKLKGSARAWIERVGGGFMIGAAILLGLKTAKDAL